MGAFDPNGCSAFFKMILFLSFLFLAIIIGIRFYIPPANYWFSVLSWTFCILFFIPSVTALFLEGEKDRFTWQFSIFHCLYVIVLFSSYGLIYKIETKWIVFASGFYTFNHFGGLALYYLNKNLIKRYSKHKNLKISRGWEDKFDDLFIKQKRAYIGIPLGFFLGVTIGLFIKYNPQQLFILCIKLTLLISCFVQLGSLIKSFILTSKPFIDRNTKQMAVLRKKQYNIDYLSLDPNDESTNKFDIETAIGLTDIRKILFYNNTFNSFLLASLLFMLLIAVGFTLSMKIILLGYLMIILVFSQIPYSIGQYKMHEVLLEEKEGLSRAELQDDLEKFAGMLPKIPLIISLSSGFVGSILYAVLDDLLKDTIK
jgi:hypothetical protein